MELSEPVTIIFNTSIKQAQLPRQWKEVDVIPVPKTTPVTDIFSDLRPISLTATLSKILESFQFRRIIYSGSFLRIFPWGGGGAFFENGPFCEIIY